MKNLTYPQVLTTAHFRFLGTLNDFLPIEKRNIKFIHTVKGQPAIKDTLEALGVPHTEIDCMIVDGKSVDFAYQLKGGERVNVYSYDKAVKGKKIKCLRPKLPRNPRFVLDSHLGKLVKHLRLLGFDSVYKKIFPDEEIVHSAVQEGRIVLTRDKGLLKNKMVQFGYWLRSPDPKKQLKEILKRYPLSPKIKPFSLCLKCNGKIIRIAKAKVVSSLPPQVKEFYRQFYRCRSCRKVYWKGSHHTQLMKIVNQAQRTV